MFTGKCWRDVRSVYLAQTHSTHWHFLQETAHCRLLDTCPKVPLISTESAAPEVVGPAKLTEEQG